MSRHEGLLGGAADEEPTEAADMGLKLIPALQRQDFLHQGNDIHVHLPETHNR